MAVAKFTASGGKLSAEIVLSEKRDGSYDMILWHSDLNKKIREWSGNFQNTDDDRNDLPAPNAVNDGRAVESRSVIAVPDGVNPCTVSLIVRQGDTELARDEKLVPPGSVDKLTRLWIDLELGGQG